MGIWQWTAAKSGSVQAEVYLEGLQGSFNFLAIAPEIARERTDFAPPVRPLPHRSHLMIFVADDLGLEVLRVVHANSIWRGLAVE